MVVINPSFWTMVPIHDWYELILIPKKKDMLYFIHKLFVSFGMTFRLCSIF